MSEYRHTVNKTGLSGFSQDPPAEFNNSSDPVGINAPLTVSNGAVIVIAATQGKKLISAGVNATIGQLGSSRVERYFELGQLGAKYIAVGTTTGLAGILVVGTADIIAKGINDAVDSHALNLQNERIVFDRGVRRKMGGAGYYD